jgi:Cyclic nucleotide-binding domain
MIEIRRAVTDDEKEAVYRFRYTVYVEEMGRYHGTADHGRRRLVDPEDDRSWIFYARDGADVVAANRCTWGAHGFSERQIAHYGLAPFLAELPLEAMLVGERTMVAASHRGSSVGAQLSNASSPPVPDGTVLAAFGACEPHLITFYGELGTVPYAPRNINSDESGYLIPLISFPEGIDALCDVGPRPGLPRCVERIVAGHCAVRTGAVEGEDAYWQRLGPTLIARSSAPGSLFSGLSEEEIRRCVRRSAVIDCATGDRILKRGGSAHNVFVVLAGRLEARDGDRLVGALGRGEVFGETAFVLQSPRTLDVDVVTPETRILSLSERTLRAVMADDSTVAAKVFANIAATACRRASGTCTGRE